MNDLTLKKQSLKEITLDTFKEAIFVAYKGGITSVAPLGFSGNTIVIYEQKADGQSGMCSQVSIRNYSGDAELLITDVKGSFIFYGRFDIDLGVDFVAQYYFRIFKKVRKYINTDMPKVSDFKDMKIPDNCEKTIGFKMLASYQNQVGYIY